MCSHTHDLRTASQFRGLRAALPRVCVLFGTHQGDHAQLLNLAQALDRPLEIKGEVDSVPMMIVDRLASAAGFRLRRKKPLLSSLLWPDLVIGGRRIVDALRVSSMSEGRGKLQSARFSFERRQAP